MTARLLARHADTLAAVLTVWAGLAHQLGHGLWVPLGALAVAFWAVRKAC